jgi:hypothetical protein
VSSSNLGPEHLDALLLARRPSLQRPPGEERDGRALDGEGERGCCRGRGYRRSAPPRWKRKQACATAITRAPPLHIHCRRSGSSEARERVVTISPSCPRGVYRRPPLLAPRATLLLAGGGGGASTWRGGDAEGPNCATGGGVNGSR